MFHIRSFTPKNAPLTILLMSCAYLACEAQDPSSPQSDRLRTLQRETMESLPQLSSPFVWVTSTLNRPVVSIIETDGNTVVATVPVPTTLDIDFTPDGRFAYLPNSTEPGTVTVVDTEDLSIVASVGVGDSPRGVAVTPDGAFAYIANTFSDEVSIIQTATNTVATTFPVSGLGSGIVVTPDGDFVYVAISSGKVGVIETATNAVVETIEVGGFVHDLGITPNGEMIYVARNIGISIIQTTTNFVVGNIPGPPFNPVGIAFTPDGAFGYVTYPLESTVSVLATATNSIVETIDIGQGGRGIDVSPDGAFVYVAAGVGGGAVDSVVVVETSNNTVIDVVEVPLGTWALAIAPHRSSSVFVEIDVKPGQLPNSVNCRNEGGAIPVAILSTDELDATAIDPSTVSFAGATETHVNRGTGEARRHEEDVDLDGDLDLIFHFRLGETNLDCSSTVALLIGQTLGGSTIQGMDTIRMVGG